MAGGGIQTFDSVCRDIRSGKFSPIYLLIGEEPYFIDQITELLLARVVKADDRDFNQTVLYGSEAKAADVINAARRFPVMAERQLVVVREAQALTDLEPILAYVRKPLSSTVLVICCKLKRQDGKRRFTALSAAVKKAGGVVFESDKIPDYRMEAYISSTLRGRSLSVDRKVSAMLSEYIGNDPARLHQILDKLQIVLESQKEKTITPEMIERNIGISKDYNNFELLRAVVERDALRAHRIAQYFDSDSANHPIQATLPVLFNYFTNLLICYYSPDRSERGIMMTLGFRFPMQARDYRTGMRNYTATKAFHAIHAIRLADARSKGIDVTSSVTNGEIMKELLHRIMN